MRQGEGEGEEVKSQPALGKKWFSNDITQFSFLFLYYTRYQLHKLTDV
jgi:hypothetical protein